MPGPLIVKCTLPYKLIIFDIARIKQAHVANYLLIRWKTQQTRDVRVSCLPILECPNINLTNSAKKRTTTLSQLAFRHKIYSNILLTVDWEWIAVCRRNKVNPVTNRVYTRGIFVMNLMITVSIEIANLLFSPKRFRRVGSISHQNKQKGCLTNLTRYCL